MHDNVDLPPVRCAASRPDCGPAHAACTAQALPQQPSCQQELVSLSPTLRRFKRAQAERSLAARPATRPKRKRRSAPAAATTFEPSHEQPEAEKACKLQRVGPLFPRTKCKALSGGSWQQAGAEASQGLQTLMRQLRAASRADDSQEH